MAAEVDALVGAANDAIRRGDLEAAVGALEQLVALAPGNPALRRQCSIALNNWGARLLRAGETHAATVRLARALALWPENVDALFNRARLCIEARAHAAALEFLRPAARLRPDDAQLALELAECELASGDASAYDRVEAALVRVARGGTPDPARRARALVEAERFDDALDTLRASGSFDACVDGATALLDVGAGAQGRAAYAHAAALGGDGARSPSLACAIGAQLGLEALHDSRDALDAARERYAGALARLDETFDAARLRRCEPALEQLQWTNYLLAYHGEDDRALQERYAAFLERALDVFAPRLRTAPPRAPRSRARVGLISSGFCHATVGSYFGAWVGALADAGFEVHVFQLGPRFDDVTEALGARAHALHKLDGALAASAARVRDAGLDLLLYTDPMVDPRTAVLAALRLAPRQASAWGWPVTTGLRTFDAYLSCAAMEPPAADAHYVEPLRLLPGLGTAYRAPPPPARRTREELGLPRGRLYIVPQAYQKLHPDGDAALARIAALDSDATVLLFGAERAVITRRLERRLAAAFAREGADAARSLRFLTPVKRSRFLEILAACDVMVDQQHWSGGNTTLDAVRAGLPVVGAAGRFMRGRQTFAMLKLLGLEDELVVAPESIAERAVAIARDPARRAGLAHAVEQRAQELYEGHGALAALVEHVRALL